MRDLNTRNKFTPDEVCELAADFPNLLAIERDEHTGGAPQRNGKHFESLKHDSHPGFKTCAPARVGWASARRYSTRWARFAGFCFSFQESTEKKTADRLSARGLPKI